MNIILLVKQVPDTTEMNIDKVTGTLIRTGVPTIINPDDMAAVEEALLLKEKYDAHLSVVTMGPPQAEDMLREIMGRGVDEAFLLSDAKFAGADTWATSTTLAAFLKTQPYDLILAGRQAIDGDTAQVGPQTAEKLHIPQVTYVEEIRSCDGKSMLVKKAYETYSEVLQVELPCLLTTLNTMNNPRGMNVYDAWRAYDKPVTKVTFADLKLKADQVGLKGSPTQVKKTFTRTIQAGALKNDLDPQEAAKLILSHMKAYLE
jgi:electron transfer flavoprotein beta subunit